MPCSEEGKENRGCRLIALLKVRWLDSWTGTKKEQGNHCNTEVNFIAALIINFDLDLKILPMELRTWLKVYEVVKVFYRHASQANTSSDFPSKALPL